MRVCVCVCVCVPTPWGGGGGRAGGRAAMADSCGSAASSPTSRSCRGSSCGGVAAAAGAARAAAAVGGVRRGGGGHRVPAPARAARPAPRDDAGAALRPRQVRRRPRRCSAAPGAHRRHSERCATKPSFFPHSAGPRPAFELLRAGAAADYGALEDARPAALALHRPACPSTSRRSTWADGRTAASFATAAGSLPTGSWPWRRSTSSSPPRRARPRCAARATADAARCAPQPALW